MTSSQTTKRSSNRAALWVVGGVLATIIFGCILVSAVGALLLVPRQETQTSSSPAALAVSESPRPELPAPIIIAPPEEGIDYESAVLANVYEQVNPSVVNISVLGDPHDAFPNGITPNGIEPGELLVISSGSGFVWDQDGHIVTNNHVIDGADLIQVTFSDGTAAIADLVGTDVDSDLAVIRINPDGYALRPVRVGSIHDVFVGMRVVAIGNPFGLDGTLTSGIVSATGRSIPARASFSIPGSIQTDAAINPGNSGGPLLSEQGELIGVNAQIRSEERANSGVGFAIPVNIVSRVVPALIANGEYEHAYIGISGQTFSPICAEEMGLPKEIRGAMVIDVLGRTPAARAGLRGAEQTSDTAYPQICPQRIGGDLITAIDGQPVSKFDDVLYYLSGFTSPGDTITLTILREGETREISVRLATRPARL